MMDILDISLFRTKTMKLLTHAILGAFLFTALSGTTLACLPAKEPTKQTKK